MVLAGGAIAQRSRDCACTCALLPPPLCTHLPNLVKIRERLQRLPTMNELHVLPMPRWARCATSTCSSWPLSNAKQADGCEPRHVRCDRKRKRSFCGPSAMMEFIFIFVIYSHDSYEGIRPCSSTLKNKTHLPLINRQLRPSPRYLVSSILQVPVEI